MLFEKCETATRNIDKVTTTDQFNTDIDDFANAMQSNRLSDPNTPPLMSGEEELDTLVSEAITRFSTFQHGYEENGKSLQTSSHQAFFLGL